MTNGWTDVANADVVLVMGGNPAENHPVGFRFVMEAKKHRKAKLVCVDPRFNRTASVSDNYVQIRSGSGIPRVDSTRSTLSSNFSGETSSDVGE